MQQRVLRKVARSRYHLAQLLRKKIQMQEIEIEVYVNRISDMYLVGAPRLYMTLEAVLSCVCILEISPTKVKHGTKERFLMKRNKGIQGGICEAVTSSKRGKRLVTSSKGKK